MKPRELMKLDLMYELIYLKAMTKLIESIQVVMLNAFRYHIKLKKSLENEARIKL
jgi:hypothetical protein